MMRFKLIYVSKMSSWGNIRDYYRGTLSGLSSHCNSLEDQELGDEIDGYPTKWNAVNWLNDRMPVNDLAPLPHCVYVALLFCPEEVFPGILVFLCSFHAPVFAFISRTGILNRLQV